jgi:hypothetical protein
MRPSASGNGLSLREGLEATTNDLCNVRSRKQRHGDDCPGDAGEIGAGRQHESKDILAEEEQRDEWNSADYLDVRGGDPT